LVIAFLLWLGSKRNIRSMFKSRLWLPPIDAHNIRQIISARAIMGGRIVQPTSCELNICVFAELCVKISIPYRFTFPLRINILDLIFTPWGNLYGPWNQIWLLFVWIMSTWIPLLILHELFWFLVNNSRINGFHLGQIYVVF
jgi:hypothetical protein